MNDKIITWDNISKSLDYIKFSSVISDIILIITSKTRIILLFSFEEGHQSVVKQLPAVLHNVNLHVRTYIQKGGSDNPKALLFHMCSNSNTETHIFTISHYLS